MRGLAAGLALAGVALVVAALATAGGGGAQPGGAAGDAVPRGLAVWVAQGCGSCHALAAADARGTMAPDLTAALAGQDAAAIRRSIVAPAADASPGWSADAMPPDYAGRIAPADLDALVAFLAAAR